MRMAFFFNFGTERTIYTVGTSNLSLSSEMIINITISTMMAIYIEKYS